MKTKIAVILIISGIIVAFGSSKVAKSGHPKDSTKLQTSANRPAEPIGGFVSEDH